MNGAIEGGSGAGGSGPGLGEGFDSGGSQSPGPPEHRPCPGPGLADDTDANSNGSSGNESNGPESQGTSQHSSHSSSSGHGKDSALLETTESSKSTNSQSPSPPSSSIAYSLLSASSEQDNPSTSGCSSEQSARARTQKELMTALRELKRRLPPERRGKGRSGTLATLQYALACVKQVQANQDYYQQWSLEESQPCSMDMSSYTLEELEHITSEYTLRNQDTFSVAVSFLTGRIVYISDQAAILLRCKKEVFRGARFSELLAPQDVGVFYGSTAPSRLPTWGSRASAGSGPMDFTQEKSVFCRIRGGPDRELNPRYQPFRLTPYVTKIQLSDGAPAQPCCLLIAERIHSGYEAPRIPPDKRIFTTRHTPSCLFQDVDERAAPLLGYLPQDLLGAPVLLFLHPEDRPLMLAIHKKILQLSGQPFDHSPIRFCARNGEYVTMDTSWAGFVHPWSRKVAFVLGRHKVRTAPLNEDVFTPPAPAPVPVPSRAMDPDIQELSEQIHRLLLQPVHSVSPAGACGLGPPTSPGPFLSPESSGDSNGGDTDHPGPPAPVTFQQICKDVHLVKHQGQQLFIDSRSQPNWPPCSAPDTFKTRDLPSRPLEPGPGLNQVQPLVVSTAPEDSERKEPSSCSYQQINCLDSIIRYLESCNVPSTVKRKCAFSSHTASSTSDDDRQKTGQGPGVPKKDPPEELSREGAPLQKEPVVGGPLTPLTLANKAESVVSITSQCSFSSTIVHVGDKKPPESDIVMMEELPGLTSGPAPSPTMATPDPTPDAYRPVGLTKAVLSLHTQKEEQAFLTRFRDLSRLRVFDTPSMGHSPPVDRGFCHGPTPSGRRHHGKSKAKRSRHHQLPLTEAPGYASHPSPTPPTTPWPSQPTPPTSAAFPTVVQTYPLPIFSARGCPQPSAPTPSPSPFSSPLVTPMVALVLPNYLFPSPPTSYPCGAPQAPSDRPLTPAPCSPSPSLPPLPPSPPQCPDSPLFNSRCSSPLQLNLLQLEETTRGEGEAIVGEPGSNSRPPPSVEEAAQPEAGLVEMNESSNQDALSGSSDLLELLLQEDSRSGTGSAASGSLASGSGSGSHGGSTSASITRSSQSSHTSKYFGSIDSSEAEPAGTQVGVDPGAGPGEQVIKYVLQDPIWLLMANADHRVMMTYQVPSRDMASVLQRDRERLRAMQKQQPRFSEEQRRELGAVHTWVRKGQLPQALDVMACVDCGSSTPDPQYPDDTLFPELDGLGLEPMEEDGGGASPDTAMDEEEQGGEPAPSELPAPKTTS